MERRVFEFAGQRWRFLELESRTALRDVYIQRAESRCAIRLGPGGVRTLEGETDDALFVRLVAKASESPHGAELIATHIVPFEKGGFDWSPEAAQAVEMTIRRCHGDADLDEIATLTGHVVLAMFERQLRMQRLREQLPLRTK